ncbi:heterokaryon incompatibility protein-domain-containing protein [Pyrenochaeta sp. MPI-SDFR-AT-0127]|nr:heterokaryon incompatibility protein-domain-containing protein [Pyrenochaeta sp. MPI-SDFR-AT-0127]
METGSPDPSCYFVHSPLLQNVRQVRLLRIVPVHTESLHPPVCQLDHFTLKYAPPYQAVSYTWGRQYDPMYHIFLNGRWYQAKKNLYDFLCSFREVPENQNGCAYLWIDQICINQTDLNERSNTVRFMSIIYCQANFVITWLGNDADTVAAARIFVHSKSSYSLLVLLNNRYFTRLWVIQEVLLAREVRVLCGNIWLSFSELEIHTRAKGEEVYSRFRNPSYYLLWDSMYNRQGRDLAQCTSRYCANDCENPRDKVYALLGLVKKEEHPIVNYGARITEVFIQTVRVLAKSEFRRRNEKTWVGQISYEETSLFLAREMYFSSKQQAKLQYFFSQLQGKEPDETWYQTVWEGLSMDMHLG